MEFDLSRHLTSSDRERDYLRRVSERCITLLFPPDFVQNNPFRHLLREILACKGTNYSGIGIMSLSIAAIMGACYVQNLLLLGT